MFRLHNLKHPVIQGSMGVGFSWFDLVEAVSRSGGLGTLTTGVLDRLLAWETGDKTFINNWEKSIEYVVGRLKDSLGSLPFGLNVMEKQTKSSELIKLAFKYKVPSLTIGAGFNRRHFKIAEAEDPHHDTNFMYMINGAKAAEITLLSSNRKNCRIPDALILEGPKAGGHNGFKTIQEVDDPKNALEACLGPCLKITRRHHIKLVVAGGIWGPRQWRYWKDQGADAMQAGTAFLGSQEVNLDPEVREKIFLLNKDDVVTSDALFNSPGSPTKFAFKVLKDSPGYLRAKNRDRPAKCSMAGILKADNTCSAQKLNDENFCLCPSLTRSSGFGKKHQGDTEKALMTCGDNGYKIKLLARQLNEHQMPLPYPAKKVVEWYDNYLPTGTSCERNKTLQLESISERVL